MKALKERAEKELALQKEAEARKTIIKMVMKFHAKGFSIEEIAEDTGLRIDEINDILKL